MKKVIVALLVILMVPSFVFADGSYLLSQAGGEIKKEEAEKALKAEEEKKPTPTEVQRGGVLVGKGNVEAELGLTYAHFSSNNIFIQGFAILPVLVIGHIAVERIRRDIGIVSLTGRYGLVDDLQLEVRVPWRFWHDRRSYPELAPPREETEAGGGIGDIEGSLYYQFLREREGAPNLIAGLTFKTRTGEDVFKVADPYKELPEGSGFYSLRGTVTAIKTVDPVVLFGTLGWTYNLERDSINVKATGQTIDVNPGWTAEYGVGMAYAINPKFSLNMQYQQSFTKTSKVNGWDQPNTALDVALLKIGAIYAYSKKSSIDFSVSTGLTNDAPDIIVELKIPFR